MTDQIEARSVVNAALEVLEEHFERPLKDWEVTAFRAAITAYEAAKSAEPEGEAVAWLIESKNTDTKRVDFQPLDDLPFNHVNWTWKPLYLHQPKAPVVTDDMVDALKRIRDTAMKHTLTARIPECAEFGGIAQDADWLLSEFTAALNGAKPKEAFK